LAVFNQDKMKILLVADVPLENPSSGSETMVNRQAIGLSRNGTEVCAIVRLSEYVKPGIKKTGGIRIGRFYASPNRFLRFSYQHLKYPAYFCDNFCRHSPFSAVIAHQPFNCFVLLIKRKINNINILYNFHSPSHEEYLLSNGNRRTIGNCLPLFLRQKIERYCLQNAQVVMAESQYMKQKVIDIHRIADEKIIVNPGGVELDWFHPAENRAFLKKELGLPADRLHLLTVRNLEPRMGLDNLLKAIALLKEKTSNVHLVIGGEGPERNNLESLIHRYELGDDVTMTGFVPAEQLPKYYGAADFFVLPTRELEGFGLVTPESMACGTPVLGTPVGGTREILSGFDSQFLFKDATPEAMAEGVAWAMDNWFNDEERYAWLRSRCRKYAEKNYSWHRHVDQLKSIIDELVAVKGELN
jgi:glycosyltransferase involved in cell wall biosynthesis